MIFIMTITDFREDLYIKLIIETFSTESEINILLTYF
jgi:hypothetical protein